MFTYQIERESPKFIFVVGGVLSGIGKGVVTASIARLLKDSGFKVTVTKIDPYINVDAGTMRPTEHGEVFVTEDGGETDQDLGTYERFLNENLSKKNNITTGQVYLKVIEKERALEYKGKNVEVIPDIPNEVKDRLLSLSEGYDFSIVEIGGTTGDIQNLVFLYAARELSMHYPSITVMVSYIPFLRNVGELKTKPTQHAVAKLREVGLFPNIIVARSETGLDDVRVEKLAKGCFVSKERIIDNPDVESIYEVPLFFKKQGMLDIIFKDLSLNKNNIKIDTKEWEEGVKRIKDAKKEVRIAIVGKYVRYGKDEHKDVYLSVLEALKHASYFLGVKPIIKQFHSQDIELKGEKRLESFDGIVVPGGFGESGIDGILRAIKYARENNKPYLGLCYGMQLAVIEYARNVCGMKGANTTEIDPHTPYPVVDILPEQREIVKGRKYGGSMRLGAWKAILLRGTLVHALYGKREVWERHRHRYEINPEYIEKLESCGIVFSGRSEDGKLMEFIELPSHKFFVATQAHPEFKSRFLSPHPLFKGLIRSALKK